MDTEKVAAWIEGYIRAWNSNDPQEIGNLFSPDAAYYTSPFAQPWQGRETIVQRWLDGKDQPGSFEFHYEVLASGDDLGVVRGWTKYLEPAREYSNIWLVRFDDQGRSKEFTEWYMQRK
jgi:uncharacterized protein (TIGR02246 family)